MRIRWLGVARDALAIVMASGFVHAIVAGAGASERALEALFFAVSAVGFCASGCLSPSRRFPHIGFVAIGAFLILALNGTLTGSASSAGEYAGLLIETLLAMLLGGSASLAIVRRPAAAPPGPAA